MSSPLYFIRLLFAEFDRLPGHQKGFIFEKIKQIQRNCKVDEADTTISIWQSSLSLIMGKQNEYFSIYHGLGGNYHASRVDCIAVVNSVELFTSRRSD